eukprot:TRINITY_DN1659_c0_g1_i3.p1 TRINITY_DN1659_c0_g1~~TRINITY_DN1659_c0_g1_i3.p1  ORF type:complete len:386 (-),score=136.01 TRINITY_DN1659_c0_g1_i3:79-1236(-)
MAGLLPAWLTFPFTLALGSFSIRMQLLWKYGFDWSYTFRLAAVLLLSFLTIPLRMSERLLFFKRIKKEVLAKPPVFILGHWRSGTTFLHLMMCSDPQWSYVPSYQVIGSKFSELFEIPFFNRLSYAMMPANRSFDNVSLHPNSPQEEELAVADRLKYSIFHYFCFPKAVDDLLRFTHFKDATKKQLTCFKVAYRTVLQKASIATGRRQLLVKNPANTARVPLLMEMFPGCKFIHITREPYVMFRSIYHFHDVMTKYCSLHAVSPDLLNSNVIKFFKMVEGQYLQDRDTIPKGRLTEIRFEDLMQDPLGQVKRMYEEIGLSGYEEALPHLQKFLAAQAEYKQNVFKPCEPNVTRLINEHWAFAFKEWHYPMRNEDGSVMVAEEKRQ